MAAPASATRIAEAGPLRSGERGSASLKAFMAMAPKRRFRLRRRRERETTLIPLNGTCRWRRRKTRRPGGNKKETQVPTLSRLPAGGKNR